LLFPTMTFFIFFLLVLGISWKLRPHPVSWKLFLLAASYVFYGWWDWRFTLLLAASTLGNVLSAQFIAHGTTDRRRRIALIAGLVFNLGLLGVFKYYGFFVESLVSALDPIGLAPTSWLIEVGLPVGISFFTFCGMSYIIDVYRRDFDLAAPIDIAVYLAFFPHLVAGPIVRAREFVPQLHREPDLRAVDATRAARLIARGLVKKVIVANYLAQAIADPVFASPGTFDSPDLIVGSVAYAVQIYADFSGYTDIAIGTALLLGIRFPENFDRPYTAATIQDFWRRWHMTLSRWLRDYLYIPLGGSHGSERATYRNLFITMGLGGLWHGARWTFVVWGLYHGLGLSVERWLDRRRDRPEEQRSRTVEAARRGLGLKTSIGDEPDLTSAESESTRSPAPRRPNPWLGRVVTFTFVVIGWIFFRAETFGDAITYLSRLLTSWGPAEQVTWLVLVTIVAALAAQYIPKRMGLALEWRVSQLPPIVQGIGFGMFLVALDLLGPQGVAPFIYFQF
jgi:alginate O-acetyltransferase complex protein AlgI